jgi:ABC-2 type transport system ATP-binding protein
VFLSSHNLDEVQTLCSRAAIIKQGRIADVRSLKNMAAGTGKKITLKGKGLKDRIEGAKVLSSDEDSLVFLYHSDDMKKLRSMLCGLDFKDILIEDEKLSDVFMSYYDESAAAQRGSGI